MKRLATTIFLLSLITVVSGQEVVNNTTKTVTQSGVGLGSIIAVVTSWDRNKSIMWAILHAILGWLYVIYFAFTRDSYNKQNKGQQQSHLFKIGDDQDKDDRAR
ncbi:hypothetical protein SAMN05660841_00381 [Sphingobacterium nematocida]|uniref:Uncharacterized protein n=1 Tax=Sphingobacterium nematocida TaxID=1513896 RepID=A0A1T5B1C0_9SPHI|nr:hypothetical protein [Sphingobacterium nematocida]SKB41022.1 hypothetical protein SAMN05660841_00381 [Sphingobacterium nematocida]